MLVLVLTRSTDFYQTDLLASSLNVIPVVLVQHVTLKLYVCTQHLIYNPKCYTFRLYKTAVIMLLFSET